MASCIFQSMRRSFPNTTPGILTFGLLVVAFSLFVVRTSLAATGAQLFVRQSFPTALLGGQDAVGKIVLVQGAQPLKRVRARIFAHSGGLGAPYHEQLLTVDASKPVVEYSIVLATPEVTRDLSAVISVEYQEYATWSEARRFTVELYPKDIQSEFSRWLSEHTVFFDESCEQEALKEIFTVHATNKGNSVADFAVVCTSKEPQTAKILVTVVRSKLPFATIDRREKDTVTLSIPPATPEDTITEKIFLIKAFTSLIQSYQSKELL